MQFGTSGILPSKPHSQHVLLSQRLPPRREHGRVRTKPRRADRGLSWTSQQRALARDSNSVCGLLRETKFLGFPEITLPQRHAGSLKVAVNYP